MMPFKNPVNAVVEPLPGMVTAAKGAVTPKPTSAPVARTLVVPIPII